MRWSRYKRKRYYGKKVKKNLKGDYKKRKKVYRGGFFPSSVLTDLGGIFKF